MVFLRQQKLFSDAVRVLSARLTVAAPNIERPMRVRVSDWLTSMLQHY